MWRFAQLAVVLAATLGRTNKGSLNVGWSALLTLTLTPTRTKVFFHITDLHLDLAYNSACSPVDGCRNVSGNCTVSHAGPRPAPRHADRRAGAAATVNLRPLRVRLAR